MVCVVTVISVVSSAVRVEIEVLDSVQVSMLVLTVPLCASAVVVVLALADGEYETVSTVCVTVHVDSAQVSWLQVMSVVVKVVRLSASTAEGALVTVGVPAAEGSSVKGPLVEVVQLSLAVASCRTTVVVTHWVLVTVEGTSGVTMVVCDSVAVTVLTTPWSA